MLDNGKPKIKCNLHMSYLSDDTNNNIKYKTSKKKGRKKNQIFFHEIFL